MRCMELAETIESLRRTPQTLAALLTGVDPEWLRRADGPGTWSAYDIVGHLLNGDQTDWLPRVRMIMEYGATRTFESVDREAMLARAPEPPEVLLERLRAARSANLEELASLGITAEDLGRTGRHPAFGEVTLGQLIATWLAHDLTHVAQVAEVLAGRLRTDVGPWRAYLPALDRTVAAE